MSAFEAFIPARFVGGDAKPIRCESCTEPAKKWIRLLDRRSRKVLLEGPRCHTHVQQELTLAASGLSMVDLEIAALPVEVRTETVGGQP